MKKWTSIIVGLVIGAIAGSFLVNPFLHSQPAGKGIAAPNEESSYRDVVKKVLPAVVSLETEKKLPKGQTLDDPLSRLQQGQPPADPKKFPDEFPPMPGDKAVPRQGFGSGFIIDPDGVIMTSFHVVATAAKVTVQLADGTKYVSDDIRGDRKTDLAIILVDTKGKKLPFLELGDNSEMEIGDHVLAVGAPFGLLGSVTHGIVSGKGRTGLKMNVYEDFVQTDAAINPGNSGGPLVNMQGKVVGINAAIKSRTGGFDGVGLAVASNLASSIKDALIKDGAVRRGYLGVQIVDLDREVAEKLGLPKNSGVVVGTVFPDTPAAKAKLQAGDIIARIAGKTITSTKMLQDLVMFLPLNKQTDVDIVRDGKVQKLPVTIEEQPDTFGTATAPAPQPPPNPSGVVELEQIGIGVIDLTPQLAGKLGYEAGAKGVAISLVDLTGPGYAAGLRAGMLIVRVNNQPVASTAAARELIAKGSLADGILLQVRSVHGGTNYVLLKAK